MGILPIELLSKYQMMILTHSTRREKVSGAAYAEKKNPHRPGTQKPMGETLAWGEPYAHPYQGFIIANPMPRKSPH